MRHLVFELSVKIMKYRAATVRINIEWLVVGRFIKYYKGTAFFLTIWKVRLHKSLHFTTVQLYNVGVNRPATVREIPHFVLFPAFPHILRERP